MAKNIALLTGGYSGESVISYKSGATFYTFLDRDLFNVYLIDIRPDGWFYKPETGEDISINKDDFSLELSGIEVKFDAVFIGIHGTPGEDGKLQSYFDMIGLPYTGCDAATSAVTFNKRFAVSIAKMAGIAVANSIHLFKNQPYAVPAMLEKIKLPVFVKPNNGGSSIGMSKVLLPDELEAAIAKAFAEDNQVIVEEMIQGREFTAGVCRVNGEIIVLPLTEVKADADKTFFDFEAKYQGKSTEVTPAQVDEAIAEKIRTAAKNIYALFNCRGVVRIDFIYEQATGHPYMLEVNTVPGQSEASIVPQQIKALGWELKTFYTQLIQQCFE